MKHKNFRSLLSILLALCMVLTLLPVGNMTVQAAEEGSANDTITISGSLAQEQMWIGKKIETGTPAGNPAVEGGSEAGWYWDGTGHFYMTNCTLTFTGETRTFDYGRNYALMYFPGDLTVHLKGENKIVLENTHIGSSNYAFSDKNYYCSYVGTDKSKDSLTLVRGDNVTLVENNPSNVGSKMGFRVEKAENCTLISDNEGLAGYIEGYWNGGVCNNTDIKISYTDNMSGPIGSILDCFLAGSSSVQVYDRTVSPTDTERDSAVVINKSGESIEQEFQIDNGVLCSREYDSNWIARYKVDDDISGKTLSDVFGGNTSVYIAPADTSQPLIIKPGAPTEYALTCTAGSGIDKDSFSVSYKHADIDAGAVKNPELTDGSYSIPEAAAVTVKMNLQAEAAFQNCTGLPSDAVVTKGEDGEITVTFTMPGADTTLTAYGYKGTPASGTAVVKKSTLLAPCAATVTLEGNTEERTVTLVCDGEEPLLLTGTNATTYKESLPQDGNTYKVYVDGADTGKTITLSGTSASASVAYQTYTVTAIKDGENYENPGVIQLMAGDTLVGNGANLPQGTYDIYLDGEKVGETNATGDNVLAFYTVTFKNGAETSEAYPAGSYYQPQVVLSGKTAVEPEVTPEAPEGMEDMFFAGWEKNSTAFDFATPITAATTLTAKWITEAEKTEDSDIEAKWTINGESSYGLLSDALAATKTAGKGQILLLKDLVALKAERENELAANVTLTVPEGKGITNAQTLTAKGYHHQQGHHQLSGYKQRHHPKQRHVVKCDQ